MKYTSTVCALCRQILRPIVRHKILPDGPTSGSWSILLSLGTTRVLTLTLSTWTTGSILKMYALRGIIVFRYCGYIFGYALRVRYCSYSHYAQYLGLLSTRNVFAASSTRILSVLGLRLVLERLSVKPFCYPEHEEKNILGGYMLYLLYLTQPATKYYGATSTSGSFLYLCRIHWTCRVSHLFGIHVYLPVPYFI